MLSGCRSSTCSWRGKYPGLGVVTKRYLGCGLWSISCSAKSGFWVGHSDDRRIGGTLLDRGADGDVAEAEAAIDRLAYARKPDGLTPATSGS